LVRRGIAPTVLTAAFLQSTADAALLTTNVSRLAVRFSTCPASAEVPPSVAALVRVGMRGLMLAKLKLVSAVLLAASTLVAGVGLLAGPAPVPSPAEERVENKPPSAPADEKPPVRHDQAGDPLPPEALSRLGTLRFRHGGPIQNLAFGPDGKSLVSDGGGGIHVWDAANGKEIPRFPKQLQAYSIALSPDGKQLAIRVSNDKPAEPPIAIHEYATGRLLRRFGDRETPASLLFSPDGKVLAASDWSRHRDIELWDPAGGRRLHTLKGHKDHVWCIAFSGDSKTLVSSSDDKTIRFWDVAAGKELQQIKHHQGIKKIALSPDGKLLASIDTIKHVYKELGSGLWSNDNRVRICDAAAGKELRTFALPANELLPDELSGIRHLDFAPDGKTLLTGSMDGILRILDPATGRELRQFPGFAGSPGPFVFPPDGKGLAVVDGGTTIRLLDLATGKDRVPSLGHCGRVSSISVAPDDQTVATIGGDNTLRFWDPETGRELRRCTVTAGCFRIPRIQPHGRTYLTVGADKVYRLNDLASGKETAVLRGHKAFYPFAVSPDGKTVASVNADKEVRLLDPATGAVRHMLTKVKHFVTGMSFSSDGRTLVVWDANQIVTVWDTATGKKRRQFTTPAEASSNSAATAYEATLSPDGKLLAFALQVYDPKAMKVKIILPVLDTTTGKEICRFDTEESGPGLMAFSPDSKSLARTNWNNSAVTLGEIATGRVRHRFAPYTGHIFSLAFSTDGKMLISGSDDTTALVWDLTGRLTMGEKLGAPLSNADLETHWKALATDDAAAGYRAMQMLASDPERSIPYLRTRLRPVAPADEKHLRQWIADLDSDQLTAREKATSELEKLGAAALHAMRKTLDDRPALETRRRLEQLIEKQERAEWLPSPERLRSRRALEVLERAGTPEAKDILTTLANGAPGAWLTLEAKAALARLAQRPARKR
jgi:WD40 repeat protein